MTTLLPQSAGWMVVIVFSVTFGVLTIAIVKIQEVIVGRPQSFDVFNVAGRAAGIGLSASVVVCKWTWAATLLQSSTVTWKYGLSGAYWYAAGAAIQITLFAAVAVKVKERAPNAHTVLEIVRARWGTAAHLVFLVFALMTNLIVTGMLLLGGSAVVNAVCGMPLEAAAFLIPIGVTAYTLVGGLRATFIAGYLQSAIIFIMLTAFVLVVSHSHIGVRMVAWRDCTLTAQHAQVYTGETIGGAAGMYDKVAALQPDPIASTFLQGNAGNSYLTMSSTNGLMFGVINVVGNFGAVFMDSSYWSSAMAADSSRTASVSFLVASVYWFSIPLAMATSLGLASRALQLPMTVDQVDSGLAPAFAAIFLLGRSGGWMILIIVFAAVASTGAAELMAVSSVITYDVYKAYVNPAATSERLLQVSKASCAVFGALMGVFGLVLNETGVSLSYVYLGMGICIGSAVAPVVCAILWRQCTGLAAVCAAVAGLVLAVASWIWTAHAVYGTVNLQTTGADYPMLVGNVVALVSSTVLTVALTLIRPDPGTDWSSTMSIADTADDDVQRRDNSGTDVAADDRAWMAPTSTAGVEDFRQEWVRSVRWSAFITFVMVLGVPIPLYLADWVFTKPFFIAWIVTTCLCAIASALLVIGIPLWDCYRLISRISTDL
ncbi:Urea active transporter [Plasmodiophora brassicae]